MITGAFLIDYVRLQRIDAALRLVIEERGGRPENVGVMDSESYTVADLERAIELTDQLFPTE
jgi:hypothetical protein